ncbi:MAG: methyltransferase domain-containing protein [Desulfuromonadales bacterium]|nr:methyltransferase domain-containing protein [Desulfuromonadales bacterium]
MVPIKAIDRRRVRCNFASHADDYDRYAVVQARVVQHLCASLAEVGLPADGRLLDIGTGTGALAVALREQQPAAEILVMDLAHEMTRTARSRLPNVLACDGDAVCLPFAAGAFAAVVSSSVYQWVECLPTAFREAARTLRPGGLFAVALFGAQTLHELRRAHGIAVARSGLAQASHMQTFPERSEVGAALAAAGLTTRRLRSVMEVEQHADVPELLRQLKQIGAGNAAVDRPRGLASRRTMQEMMAIYEDLYRSAAGIPASYEVILAIAVKPD